MENDERAFQATAADITLEKKKSESYQGARKRGDDRRNEGTSKPAKLQPINNKWQKSLFKTPKARRNPEW